MWLFCDLGLITHSLLVTVKLLKGLGERLIQSFWVYPELKKLYIWAVIETFWLTLCFILVHALAYYKSGVEMWVHNISSDCIVLIS